MSREFEDRIGSHRRDTSPAKAGLANLLYYGSVLYRRLYRSVDPISDAAQSRKVAVSTAVETSQHPRLEPIPFEIEIPTVSEEVYAETRKAVETAIPDVFITTIRIVSIEDLLEEDKQRGQRRFTHYLVDSSKTMRATVPPEMEVFINPKAVRVEGSNSLSTDAQKAKIAEVAASFRQQLPEGVRGFVNLHMVDPSTMSQVEDAWADAGNSVLLPDYFARTDVKTVRDNVAGVGRRDPRHRRGVDGWYRDGGGGPVFAVPVGVLPRKLTA